MKLDEYIRALTELREAYGNLEVEHANGNFDREAAPLPKIAHRKLLKGRESKPSFWSNWDEEDRKGDPVVRV